MVEVISPQFLCCQAHRVPNRSDFWLKILESSSPALHVEWSSTSYRTKHWLFPLSHGPLVMRAGWCHCFIVLMTQQGMLSLLDRVSFQSFCGLQAPRSGKTMALPHVN
jgi:hypothetical protein